MKKIIAGVLTILVMFFAGSLAFAILLASMCAGKLKIAGSRNIPRLGPRTYVLSNHPNACLIMGETFFVPAAFFVQAILHPLGLAPLILIDGVNFLKKWYFYWLRLITISIDRGGENKDAFKESDEIKNALLKNRVVMSFGPGRDPTGPKLWRSKSEKNFIRRPTNTLGRLLSSVPDIHLIIVWVSAPGAPIGPKQPLFYWPKLPKDPIVIGFEVLNSNDFLGQNPHTITRAIADIHLALGDRVTQG